MKILTTKNQIPNSKFQTKDLSTHVLNSIITGRRRLVIRCDTTMVNVLVIELDIEI